MPKYICYFSCYGFNELIISVLFNILFLINQKYFT